MELLTMPGLTQMQFFSHGSTMKLGEKSPSGRLLEIMWWWKLVRRYASCAKRIFFSLEREAQSTICIETDRLRCYASGTISLRIRLSSRGRWNSGRSWRMSLPKTRNHNSDEPWRDWWSIPSIMMRTQRTIVPCLPFPLPVAAGGFEDEDTPAVLKAEMWELTSMCNSLFNIGLWSENSTV